MTRRRARRTRTRTRSSSREPARSDAGPGGATELRVEFRVTCRAVPLDRTRLRHVLRRIFADHGRLHGLLSIAVVGDGTIRRINRDFLAHDEPTDVITFPLDDGDGGAADDPFGEILVSAQTARREAVARGVDAPDELALYIIHGALHLAGYDDSTAAKRRRMRARERKYVGVYRKARRHGRDTEKR